LLTDSAEAVEAVLEQAELAFLAAQCDHAQWEWIWRYVGHHLEFLQPLHCPGVAEVEEPFGFCFYF
jgi:hypothetical protein